MILGKDGHEIHPIDPINRQLDQHTKEKQINYVDIIIEKKNIP